MNTSLFLSDAKSIYDNLMDEQSRTIFSKRLLFSVTNDYKHIVEMVLSIYPRIKENLENYGDIIIYGAGELGMKGCQFFGDRVVAVCDSDTQKQGSNFCDHMVISPQQLVDYQCSNKGFTIFISPLSVPANIEITESLIELGFNKDQILSLNRDVFYADYDEKEIQYFDKSIPRLEGGGVFVDCGSCDFENSLYFAKWSNWNYERIIAFEPNPEWFLDCVRTSENIQDSIVLQQGVWHTDGEITFNINDNTRISSFTDMYIRDKSGCGVLMSKYRKVTAKTVRIDDVLKGEKASLIKMDVEGAELNALKGATDTIRQFRPKLAICLYHTPEDILEIPLFVKSIEPNYKFYIRHYTLCDGETVLYAI